MCWSETASFVFTGVGAGAAVWTMARGARWPIPATLGYFAAMEGLQAAGYMVIDQCGDPVNQSLTLLSYLHICFQPFFINAFAMELVPERTRRRVAGWVYSFSGLSTAVMLLQLYPLEWAGQCLPDSVLCGAVLCLRSGVWHQAWDLPYNGLMVPLMDKLGIEFAFPTYALAGFVLPALYGAWRFSLYHLLLGPGLAYVLTSDLNEFPAIWCLFAIGIALIALFPPVRRLLTVRDAAGASNPAGG